MKNKPQLSKQRGVNSKRTAEESKKRHKPFQPIQLQLTSGGKTIGKIDLPPVLQLRLRAFAFSNGGVGLLEMIDLCLRHTTAPENNSPALMCPDEEEILDLAAGMLMLMEERISPRMEGKAAA
jgi:hypothetical protein